VSRPDAVVVGSGPNGLAAALTLARAGLVVEVYEGAPTPGGGCRTEELTLPGFQHDVCSAVHPLLAASPFFLGTDLAAHGVKLLRPEVAFAHPLDGGQAAVVSRSVDVTAAALGSDGQIYRRLLGPLVRHSDQIVPTVLGPLRSIPPHALATGRFGAIGLLPARTLAGRFRSEEARALLAGAAAHSMSPLTAPLTSAFALLLIMLAHTVGWPVVEGGSGRIVDGLTAELESLGGRVVTDRLIQNLDELPRARATLLDLSPNQLVTLGADLLTTRQRRPYERFRYGPGVFKMDWALAGPVPWSAEACRRTCTVHVGGTLAEIAHGEAEVAAGRHPARPYCIVTQPCLLDHTRAPNGLHTLWAYCHVPSDSSVDMADRIEGQIERFAPGFRDLVIARATKTSSEMQRTNPNNVGGSITGGAATLRQTIFRPTVRWNPYRTPIPGVYLCSAATPPGGGVHGMCGAAGAAVALGDLGVHPG
jgi:phytoene dehydrogenase-like protein